ncbi:MAG: helix-turn-helix transcriptional regulator [Cyclobacteriaceae bacterium]
MKTGLIGEFEEIVLLTIIVLESEAYGVSIKRYIEENLDRSVSLGAMRSALDRLEQKGYLESQFGEPTAVRGGKRKKFFVITSHGFKVVEQVKNTREKLWNAVPKTAHKFYIV